MKGRFTLLAAGMATAWLAYGLVWAAIVLPRHGGRIGSAVMFNLALVLPLAASALLVVPVAHFVHARQASWRTAVVIHGFVALAVVLFDASALRAVGVVRRVPVVSLWNARSAIRDLLAYALMASATHALAYRVSSRREEERAAVLDAALTRRRMDALRWSLRPEAILSALERVGRAAERDPERADAEVVRLADALRMLLVAPETTAWPLRQELKLLRALRRLSDPDHRVALVVPRALRDVPTPRSALCAAADLWRAGCPMRVSVEADNGSIVALIEGASAVPAASVERLAEQLCGVDAASHRATVTAVGGGAVRVFWPRDRPAPA